MKKVALPTALAFAFAAACTPNVDKSPPPTQVHAQFDPSTTPATVPSPNSLAINPQTGKVELPLPPNASEADQELAQFLSTLDGFPADSVGQASFTGQVDPNSVTPQSVQVIDVTSTPMPVTGYTPSLAANPPKNAGAGLVITPPVGGWKAGHSYAVALLGGDNGLKGTDGKPVIGSAVWALATSPQPLVTCTDLTSPDCKSVTGLLSNAQAVQLEGLRRQLAPFLDQLAAAGLPRNDIVLAWTFKIASDVVMAFQPAASPPEVPTPNDLARNPTTGTLNLPVDPTSPPANQAFVRDYLNTLNGYPPSTPGGAPAAGGELDPATVSAATVRVVDVTPPSDGGMAGGAVNAKIGYDPTRNAITLTPPTGGWVRGHQYAVAVVGGASGVKSSSGGQVIPSSVWVLARGNAPVATCTDPTNPGCTSTLSVISLTDAEAAQLERLRQAMQPLLAALSQQGLSPEDVPVAWAFSIFSNPEATFDPANQVIPFPNDLLRVAPTDGGTAHVNLPVPTDGGTPQEIALATGLNTLDGFSTSAPTISENSNSVGPLTEGAQVDPASLSSGTGFVRLQGSSDPNVLQTDPQVTACVSCASSALPDGGSQIDAGIPEQLQFVPSVPLDEQTTYAAFMTTALKATDGTGVVATPTFALVRSPDPLVDSNGKSQVSGVSDAQAAQAEPLRQALKPLFDALEAAGHPRKELALAWGFTTESTVSQLAQLRALPATAGLPDTPIALAADPNATVGANESAIYVGEIASAFALTGPSGTLNPTGATPNRLSFTLVLPKNAAPAGGYPVAVYGHGIAGDRNEALILADALAQGGIATFSIDEVWFGDRSSCTGSAVALQAAGVPGATDDFACGGPGGAPNPVTQQCNEETPIGRCVSRAGLGKACTFLSPTAATDGTGGDLYCAGIGEGACQPTADGMPGASTCEGGDFWRPGAGAPPVISGWNAFNPANLFGTRDNFRQQVIDFAQVVRVIQGTGSGSLNDALTTAGASGTLNAGQIQFLGTSLGGITGTLFNAVSPDTHRVVLNVPAGDLTQIILTTQSTRLVATRDALLAGLAGQGITPGTPQFDTFIGTAKWILDPADPINSGVYLAKGNYIPGDRKTFIQFIEGDQTLPNPTTQELIAATIRAPNMTCASGGAPPCADTFEFTDQQFGSVLPAPGDRHGFLINGASAEATSDAQSQVVQYLTQGNVKTTFP